MKLYINTGSNGKTIIKLDDLESVKNSRVQHSQVVLPIIKKLLKRKRAKISDITKIEVFTGPGSFTGLRVGVAIANALGFALKIPVNGKNPWEMDTVEPIYE